MRERSVASILGTTRKINERLPDVFYKRLQNYVDSKEKGTEKLDKNGNKIGLRKRPFEAWPLIKVVRIYVKADALSTGAVIVDLPGVHDSNAARAAVAEGYMKQCTGLWIVAPITRAVDDKAAQKLLGDTFKRQLKYDGTYSSITFICSKTDDISKLEATDSLQLGDQMDKIEDRLTALRRERSDVTARIKEAKGKKADHESAIDDIDDKLEVYDQLKDRIEDGETVFAPKEKSQKRKRANKASSPARKKRRGSLSDDEIEIISSDEDLDESSGGSQEQTGPPLTQTQIEQKLDELKALKKDARREKGSLEEQIRDCSKRVKKIESEKAELDDKANQMVVAGRNEYSRSAIRQDFAAGVRELDQENLEEEDPDNFNPDEEVRDYDEVARSLPVFCVSSRAYQKLSQRMQKDNDVAGFTEKEQTEIPQLQAHCKQLTEKGRGASCRRFLNSLSRLVSSLALWASDDGTGPKLNAQQYGSEERYLTRRLQDLDKALQRIVSNTIEDAVGTLDERIFEKFDPAIQTAAKNSLSTQARWGAHRDDGGLPWATYKATVRRGGVFQGSRGLRDFNTDLMSPLLNYLQNHWEKAFQRKLPHIFNAFAKSGSVLLKDFHTAVETRCRENGIGIARIGILGNQLRNHERELQDVSAATTAQLNERQREINREFVPQIALSMQPVYDECMEISGSGSFKRMKASMEQHVEANRILMFQGACQEVRQRLEGMFQEVQRQMSERADSVFKHMRGDYMSLVGGQDQGPLLIPQEERAAKREVDEVISLIDEEFKKVIEADMDTLREASVSTVKTGSLQIEELEDAGGEVDDDILFEEDDDEMEDEQEEGAGADAESNAEDDDE